MKIDVELQSQQEVERLKRTKTSSPLLYSLEGDDFCFLANHKNPYYGIVGGTHFKKYDCNLRNFDWNEQALSVRATSLFWAHLRAVRP